ncbi:hypothetical protein [Bacillus salacetis]|nr:hypothetical protein [Bacillus salacetis]
MKKWVISAVVYLLLITAGYVVYAQFANPDAGSHGAGHSTEL